MVELPSQPPSATVIPARLEGGEGDEGRTGAAVTRSQKRKRDEEEALVVRTSSVCTLIMFLRRKRQARPLHSFLLHFESGEANTFLFPLPS
jgi:hypothetical protein